MSDTLRLGLVLLAMAFASLLITYVSATGDGAGVVILLFGFVGAALGLVGVALCVIGVTRSD